MSNSPLRLNPGGTLLPSQVVGRDGDIEDLWDVLERQSVLLTAERRMGKTSMLNKMHDAVHPGFATVLRNLQDVTSPDEFVRRLLADIEKTRPGTLAKDGSLRARLERAGVKSVGVSHLSVEFSPTTPETWKDVIAEAFDALSAADRPACLVFLWDELPHMIDAIREHQDERVARELLDVLRRTRESHSGIRMVYSGSLGLHHVLAGLRSPSAAWAPVNDMRVIDLPPISLHDATYLAGELLRNEAIGCEDHDAVASAIASAVDAVPYYVHQTVSALQDAQRRDGGAPARVTDVSTRVQACLADPLDPWQLLHYVDRLTAYYGQDAAVVKATLDAIAVAAEPLTFAELESRIASALQSPPSSERLHELLDLLGKDHYLSFPPGTIAFRLDLLRRAWIAKRHL